MLVVARLVLAIGGAATLIGGLLLMALGLSAGAWLRSLLPPVLIDSAAVGGAAFALGVVASLAGAAQLAIATWARRGGRWFTAGAAVLAGLLASVLLACAVAAATETARGGSVWFLAGSLALAIAAIAYAAAALGLGRASMEVPSRSP